MSSTKKVQDPASEPEEGQALDFDFGQPDWRDRLPTDGPGRLEVAKAAIFILRAREPDLGFKRMTVIETNGLIYLMTCSWIPPKSALSLSDYIVRNLRASPAKFGSDGDGDLRLQMDQVVEEMLSKLPTLRSLPDAPVKVLLAWLDTVIFRRGLRHKDKKKQEISLDDLGGHENLFLEDNKSATSTSVLKCLIGFATKRLSLESRAVLWLRYVAGYPSEEAADILNDRVELMDMASWEKMFARMAVCTDQRWNAGRVRTVAWRGLAELRSSLPQYLFAAHDLMILYRTDPYVAHSPSVEP